MRSRASAIVDNDLITFDPRYIAGATLYTTDISVALIFPDLNSTSRRVPWCRSAQPNWPSPVGSSTRRCAPSRVTGCWPSEPATAAPW